VVGEGLCMFGKCVCVYVCARARACGRPCVRVINGLQPYVFISKNVIKMLFMLYSLLYIHFVATRLDQSIYLFLCA
jgi:hypothetical protein